MANISYKVRNINTLTFLSGTTGTGSIDVIDDTWNTPPTNTLSADDGLWLTYTGGTTQNANIVFRGSFLPNQNFTYSFLDGAGQSQTGLVGAPLLTSGANLQIFRTWVRKSNTGGANPVYRIFLYDNNVLISQSGNLTLADQLGGQYFEYTWNANTLISSRDGKNVAIEIAQTQGTGGGNANNRRSIEIGAVEWYADVISTTPYKPYSQSMWVG